MARADSDYRLAEAKAKDIGQVADRLDLRDLVKVARERVGPCPKCGGRDRFAINTQKGVFNCRICGAKGGAIDLVMFVRDIEFPAALDWLCGPRQELSAAEIAERERKAAETRAQNEARAARERQRAIEQARAMWQEGQPPEDSLVRAYLDMRGIARGLWPALPICLRYHPALPYMHQIEKRWVELHRGPAMLAAVQGMDGRFSAVHRTWIDLDRPKGKAVITHPVTGEVLKSKKSWGAKKGGAIRLTGSVMRPVMVMGEGIETTASALVSGAYPDATFWAGVDLGNMAGQRIMGRGLKYAGIPDMEDAEAWVPPPWVERLIFIQDGDSEARETRAKLMAGLRRAMVLRPGLKAQIVHAGEGVDLNDVLMGQGDG